MTGTTSLKPAQALALAVFAADPECVRLIVTPKQIGHAQDLLVTIVTLSGGDLLHGTRYVLESGRVLTTQEYEKLVS